MTLLWAAANAFRSQKNVALGKKYFLIELSFIVSVDLSCAEKRILLLTRNMLTASYFVSISLLLCLAFLYRWHFLSKISLYWPVTLTNQPSTSKLSDNPMLITTTSKNIVIKLTLLTVMFDKVVGPMFNFLLSLKTRCSYLI